jgi:hypothetical protein
VALGTQTATLSPDSTKGDGAPLTINDRYGEFVITPALMMGMENTILDRIAFGGVKEMEEIYTD